MKKQVFLGGICGTTTWRREIAIPALEAAGVTYHNPQLEVDEWTEAHEAAEVKAKEEADVFLFVLGGETRGVGSIAEVSYLLGMGRPLALTMTFIPEGAVIDGHPVTARERADLNRGRFFVRTMAARQNVPVFTRVEEAVQYAIKLVKT